MNRRTLAILAALVLAAPALTAVRQILPRGEPVTHDVRPGPGVKVRNLSEYQPGLAGTPGDTRVYVIEGGEPGGTVFVAGGTHANEIAGSLAAVSLVERARVERGRLIVAPYANNSAASYVDPRLPGPSTFRVETASGARTFRYGARWTKAEHQGAPDPAKYRHPASAEELDGVEARNLDRAYPGRADGTLTERIAWAFVSLIKSEGVDIAFDLHEAGAESRLAWMIVANPKNVEVGAVAVLSLEAQGIDMKLEPSSETFRGLSHREWGDATGAQAFLFETPSPGFSKGDPVNDPALPLARRVGVHLSTFMAVLEAYNEGARPARTVRLADVPLASDLEKAGLAAAIR